MFADYNTYGTSASLYPFEINLILPPSGTNEFTVRDSIATEFYKRFGSDITFLPREVNKEETTFGEYLSSVFNKGIPLRMFIEETESWSGNGDMYTRFGLQVTDECTLYINKSYFNSSTTGLYPKQGDLFYINKSQKLFQISHIEDEVQPAFYLLGNRAGYKFTCKLFAYTHEIISQEVSSGIPAAIQAIDSLLQDLNGDMVTLPVKEYNQNNLPIINSSIGLIDDSEDDPLIG